MITHGSECMEEKQLVEGRRRRERENKYEEKVGLALLVKLSNRDHNF